MQFEFNNKTFLLEDYRAFVPILWDRIFISYAIEDEKFCKELEKQLWPLQQNERILIWNKQQIKPGQEKDPLVHQELERADIIVLLLSADFFYNRDLWNVEFKRALERNSAKECTLAAVVLTDCHWESTKLHGVKLIRDGVAIGEPRNATAWKDVVLEIKGIIDSRKGGKL
jgi:internalin A